ncbi:hypothetical protein SDC9_156250 [bioreactor metagenome]|uniref:Uncharacterized protein n=1 Tax=bioreactor metagenome TaxID=1076179 RepID=A0A645F601_9ZZZZ
MGGRNGCFFVLFGDSVYLTHEQENDKGYDEEIDHVVQKETVVQGGGTGRLGICQGGIRLAVQTDVQVGEIHLSQHQTDGRHDHIIDQGADDLTKGRTDDDTDGQVHHIAAHGEISKLF